ncbi:hypothetical protein Q3G72_022348 [Acer saccharum]|nr:hypothetical protein Q3G72_022348 [Acer saccharum]
MDSSAVKQEKSDFNESEKTKNNNSTCDVSPIGISSDTCSSSSTSSSSSEDESTNEFLVQLRSDLNKKRNLSELEDGYLLAKKPRTSGFGGEFLSFFPKDSIQSPMPLSFVPPQPEMVVEETMVVSESPQPVAKRNCKQFWKAGDYEGGNVDDSSSSCKVARIVILLDLRIKIVIIILGQPFWRLWNAAGSDGRGIIGVLEANFVEPAHDKQSFERTPVLARLENRLIKFQKAYWGNNCQEVGYAPRRHPKKPVSPKADSKTSISKMKPGLKLDKRPSPSPSQSPSPSSAAGDHANQDGSSHEESPASIELEQDLIPLGRSSTKARTTRSRAAAVVIGDGQILSDSSDEHVKIPQPPKVLRWKDDILKNLQHERDRNRSLEDQLKEAQEQLEKARQEVEESNQEQHALIDILQEERERREEMEEKLREKLREASNTIGELVEKVKQLERRCK